MAITRLPNINDISQLIENSLNNISAAMKDASAITSEIVYKISAEVAEYDEMVTKEDSNDVAVRYTPGLLISLGNFDMTQDMNYTSIQEAFVLDIYGYDLDMEDHKKIMDEYIFQRSRTGDISQSNDLVFTLLGYKTNYTLGKPIMSGHIKSQDGSGVDRFVSTNTFYFYFEDGGISYNEVSLTIDNTQVPFLNYQVSPSNSLVSNIWLNEETTKSLVVGTGYTIQIDLPVFSSNAKIVSLLAEAKALTASTPTLNTTHTIVFNDSITSETYTCTLSSAPFGIQYGGNESFSLTFVPFKSGIL